MYNKMKECKECKTTKPLNEYFKRLASKDGYENQCKICRKAYVSKTQKHTHKKYYQNNREERITKNRIYELSNKNQTRENHKLYMRKRRQDSKWRLKESIMALINFHLPKKSKRTNEYLGCSYEEYFVYLQERFDGNMSWENYGSYWEIDHTYPLSKGGSFHYTNTQPMEVTENRTKSNKINV